MNQLILPRQMFVVMVEIHIMVNLILGGLFLWFSTSESKYGGPDCISLRFYSYKLALVTLTTIIFQIPTSCFIVCSPDHDKGVREFYSWFNLFSTFTQCFLFIVIFVVLLKDEPCGKLHEIAGFFFCNDIWHNLFSICLKGRNLTQ